MAILIDILFLPRPADILEGIEQAGRSAQCLVILYQIRGVLVYNKSMIDFLESADERRTVTKSSISQAREHILSVTNNLGQYFPIVFDHLDWIDCDQIKWHQETVSDSDELAYMYPISECAYYTDQYVYVDEHGKELRTLPHWMGEGFYEAYVDRNTFVNFDDQAFGVRNKQTLQNGLHYAVARDNI